ncbi:egg cell-secreted protein 1.4-like [Malania oleifera]|uniref:egg cell-secreted protein 1.4-like n=1 Tax=Malania oleifera TaxID=397392 RepID=UPI0025ADCCAD|nr:egg cell-secreted protein 1.4-like [Malania oleifera]
MAFLVKFLVAALLACTIAASPAATARPLASRLQADNSSESNDCWDSLFELQSCMGEVITFFLNGETSLGADCCRAVHTVEHHCWPAMLGSLGFTAEEGDILHGYCDAEEEDDDLLHPPPQPLSGAENAVGFMQNTHP